MSDLDKFKERGLKRAYWINVEEFPDGPGSEWQPLFDAEGREIRGEPMQFDWLRYANIKNDKRLVFVACRLAGKPAGYCAGYVFRDLHWNNRIAVDDIWYVKPEHRNQGVGGGLKRELHAQLKRLGATKVYELTRNEYYHPILMSDVGYRIWGTRWVRDL